MAEKKVAKTVKKEKAEAKVTKNTGASLAEMATVNFPHTTEKSIGLIEKENTLVFIVDKRANKTQIKQSIEKSYGVEVLSVKTAITQHNFKKAFVRLVKENPASDLAIKLGVI